MGLKAVWWDLRFASLLMHLFFLGVNNASKTFGGMQGSARTCWKDLHGTSLDVTHALMPLTLQDEKLGISCCSDAAAPLA